MHADDKRPGDARGAVRDVADRIEEAFHGLEFDERLIERIVERPLLPRTRQEALYLLSTIPAAIVAMLIWSVGGPLALPLAVTIVGIPLLILMFWLFRRYAHFERRRLRIVDPRPLEFHYERPEGNLLEQGVGYLSDPQTWRDMGWMLFLSMVGLPLAVLGLSIWLIAIGWTLYPLWGWALPGDFTPLGSVVGADMSFLESFLLVPLGLVTLVVAAWTCAGLTQVLVSIQRAALGDQGKQALRARVSEVERTRDQSLAQQSTQMTRIERDLHDGAQARLVALAMDLGMAEQKLEDDPEAARRLVAEARDEAQRTLQELRDLVRGIGPQILRDRGLEAALLPLAARSPIGVEVSVDLPVRPAERVESAAYFVASEALANAIKHSGATHIRINAWQHDRWFYVRISDNGTGGADAEGGGLRGLRARVEAVDGRLIVDSPSGGPTIIDGWLPMS